MDELQSPGRRRSALVTDQRGFTLVEILVAVFILMIGVLGTVALIDGANATTAKTKTREAATNLAREIIEDVRLVPYTSITTGGLTPALQTQPDLADESPGTPWTIRRRGVSYEVQVISACALDDAGDQYERPHASGLFCPDSAPAGTRDSNADDYRRVVLEVRWDGNQRRVRQTTIVANPGNVMGPAVTSLTRDPNVTTEVTSNTPATVSFDLTTSAAAAKVEWSIDSGVQGQATGSGTNWEFSWPFTGYYDGTYFVSVRAYDSGGLTRGPRSIPVKLNRSAPRAPTGLRGVRVGGRIDFTWDPNPERDIVGYRVFRVDAPSPDTAVCDPPLVSTTSCSDLNPIAGRDDYYVIAYDWLPESTTERASARTTTTVVK